MNRLLYACMTLLIGALLVATTGQAQTPSTIKNTVLRFHADISRLPKSAAYIIRDSQGEPAYKLTITAETDDKRTIDRVELKLISLGSYRTSFDRKFQSNLLNPDRWEHSIGPWVIQPEELCPTNKDNPLRGAHREFELRRMRLSVDTSDVEFSKNFIGDNELNGKNYRIGGLIRLNITVKVEPSASEAERQPSRDYGNLNRCNPK